jgi:hypothetical protein
MHISKYSLILFLIVNINFCYGQDCYQDYVKERARNHSIKYIGKYNDKTFYAEIFTLNNGGGTGVNYILLRTDSTLIKDFDFCFEQGMDFLIYNVINIFDTTSNKEYSLKDIKTIYQVLYSSINFAWLDNDETKLYFKKEFLFLEYFEGSCISNCPNYKVTEKYQLLDKKFKLVKRIRKQT